MLEKIKIGKERTKYVRESGTDTQVRSRKTLAITLSLLMVFAAFLSITMFTNTSSAQTQVPTYNGWAGYQGNQTIYLSSQLSNGDSYYYFPTNSTSGLHVQNSDTSYEPNEVDVQAGGQLNSSNGNTFTYEEYYLPKPDNQIVINIPVTSVIASNWTDENLTLGSTYWALDYEQISVNVSKEYPSALTEMETPYNEGINVSSTYYAPTNLTKIGWDTFWYVMGSIPYGIGQVFSTYHYEQGLYYNGQAGLLNTVTNWTVTGGKNYTVGKFGLDHMRTQTSIKNVPLGTESYGYDFNGISTAYSISIEKRDFVNATKLVIGSHNIGMYDDVGVITQKSGSYASVQINMTPAYTITGTAYVNGAHVGNNTRLLLESSSADYYIYTNANGQYKFFAQPGVNYLLTSPSAQIGGIQIDPSSTDTGGGNYDVNLTTLTFSESGISGQTWSVTLSGLITPSGNQQTYSSSTTGTSMTFEVESNEIYGWSVSSPNGYTVSPSSGNVNVGGNPATVSVTYTKTPSTYTVTFHESGLPSGTQWSATLNGNTKSSTSSSISFYSIPDGSYSWSVPTVYYSTTLWYETTTASSGTVTVSGSSASVSVSFIGVQQNPNSCVYAQAPVLLSNYTTQYAQNITTGESIMTYNFSTHSMQAGTVQVVYVTHHSSMYVINGYLKVAGDQDIWTNHGYIQAQNLTNNDTIFNVFTQHFNKVHSISVEHGNFTMYDFYVTGNHNYIVWWNLMQDRLP